MGISLWIVPSDEDAHRLEHAMRVCDQLASTRGESTYPKFYPHITLASLPPGIDPSDVSSCFPISDTPLKIHFASVDIGDHYFRSVYLAIKPTPEIVALHQKVHNSLKIEPRTPSFPHLSLCYIADEDAKKGERKTFYKAMNDDGRIGLVGSVGSAESEGVSIDCGRPGAEDWMDGFHAKEIWVVNCEGPVEQWPVLDKIGLYNKSPRHIA